MSYTDEIQTPEEAQRQRQIMIIAIVIAALVLIGGCIGLYLLVGNRPAPVQGQTVVAITSLPSLTPSLTPIPSDTPDATLQEGTGGGGDESTETPTPTDTEPPAIRTAILSEIRGSVMIKTLANADWVTVTSDLSIPEGTTILTSEASSVKLTMTEGTIIRVSSQTQIQLAEMHGTTLDPITRVKIDFGKMWTIVGDGSLGLGKFEVETPLGIASVVGTFMGVEHNSTQLLDIITCLEGKCRYSNKFGVLDLATLQQLITDGTGLPGPADPMAPDQIDSWSPTRVPEVITLTPTITPTFTPSETRTPTNTRTPVNTPNHTATSGAVGTSNAQTSTAAAGNLTSTVFFINMTATAGAGSTSGARTATAAIATANQNATNVAGTAIGNNRTATANAVNQTGTASIFQLTLRAILTNTAAAEAATAFASANPSRTPTSTPTNTPTSTATATALPAFSLSATTYSANESAGKVTITIRFAVTPVAPVSVQLDTSITGGSSLDATSGADFTPLIAQTITFPAGQSSRTVDITLIDDGITESNETFQVVLSNPSPGTAIADPPNFSAIVTINDSPPPSVGFSASTYTAPEGNAGTTNASIVVNLSRAYANTTSVTVDYSTFTGGTATGGGACGGAVDYVTPTGTLTFAFGVSSQTFNVVVCGDTLNEQDETVFVQLTNETNTASGGLDTATVTITNDDLPPIITIAPGTPTIAEPGGLGGTVIVTLDVTLSSASGQTITVNYASSPVTATEGPDYTGKSGTLTFPATTVGPQQITITVKGDFLDEIDETFDVILSNPVNATLPGLPGDRSTITIADDGDPSPNASFSASPYTVTEGNSGQTTKTITVNLDRQSGQTIVIGFSTSNGGSCGANAASAGSDYISALGSLTFLPEDLSEDFTVTVNGDIAAEPAECLTLTLNAVGATVNIPTPTSELWINNDD